MPHAVDWDKLKTFHAAAETGSLTAAADKLRISQSAVSRQITALEESLDMPLFHRHARGLTLTEEGRILYQTTDDVTHKIALVQARVLDNRQKPQGVLRVSAPISLGSNWLPSVLPEFLETYPDIDMQLILEDEEHDLTDFDVDVALRPWPTKEGDVIERKLGTISQSLYASHKYLAKYGAPSSVDDLDNHKIIAFGDLLPGSLQSANWVLRAGREKEWRKPALVVNNLHGIMRAAEAGVGLAGLPDYMPVLSKRLVRILPSVRGDSIDVFFVYPTEMRGSVRVTVFREFLMRVAKTWT